MNTDCVGCGNPSQVRLRLLSAKGKCYGKRWIIVCSSCLEKIKPEGGLKDGYYNDMNTEKRTGLVELVYGTGVR